jgi:hypothetical protein
MTGTLEKKPFIAIDQGVGNPYNVSYQNFTLNGYMPNYVPAQLTMQVNGQQGFNDIGICFDNVFTALLQENMDLTQNWQRVYGDGGASLFNLNTINAGHGVKGGIVGIDYIVGVYRNSSVSPNGYAIIKYDNTNGNLLVTKYWNLKLDPDGDYTNISNSVVSSFDENNIGDNICIVADRLDPYAQSQFYKITANLNTKLLGPCIFPFQLYDQPLTIGSTQSTLTEIIMPDQVPVEESLNLDIINPSITSVCTEFRNMEAPDGKILSKESENTIFSDFIKSQSKEITDNPASKLGTLSTLKKISRSTVTISSEKMISAIKVYSTDGKLLLEKSSINKNNIDIALDDVLQSIQIVKVQFSDNTWDSHKYINIH